MKNNFVKIILAVIMLFLCSACDSNEAPVVNEVGILSTTVMELEMGETDELSVLNYSGEVKWSSSDNMVATVNNAGVVTPVTIGSAAITAELDNGETMTCIVEVTAGTSLVETVAVTSIYSSASDITANYNDSQIVQLEASCTPYDPDEKLTWSSSDESIATVDQSGFVTLRGNGVAEIKAAALNGVEGVCIVRVKNVPENVAAQNTQVNETTNSDVPVIESEGSYDRFTSPVPTTSPSAKSSIIVSDRRVYLDVAESFTLTYAVGNTENKNIEWQSSDKTVAIVKDGVIVGIGNGRATISAVTHDGAVASCQVAVGKEAVAELKEEAKSE